MCRSGYRVGRFLARKLMQECGLESRQRGNPRYRGVRAGGVFSFTKSTEKTLYTNRAQSVMERGYQLYQSEGRLVLVIDLYSRRIVGNAMSSSLDADLVCRAMRNALETRRIKHRLLFHSDSKNVGVSFHRPACCFVRQVRSLMQ